MGISTNLPISFSSSRSVGSCSSLLNFSWLVKFAVEVSDVAKFIGYIALGIPAFHSHFTPCVEIGWRLASQYWGQGYATEGAKSVKDFAFNDIGLREIVSFTALQNYRSRRVMEKIGLIRDQKLIESVRPIYLFYSPSIYEVQVLSRCSMSERTVGSPVKTTFCSIRRPHR